jgi:biopolymer transport protein ExbD
VRFRKVSRPAVAINIAPLVDVVFLLVIFFAVSTTFLETSGIKLELPGSTSTARREVQEIAIYLGSDGALTFGGREVTLDELRGELATELEKAESKVVVLRADTTAQREPQELTVFLASDGTLSYEGDELAQDELRERLRGDLADADQKMVVLRADTNTSHGAVVEVMDLIRESGAEGLTVAARTAAQ